MTIAWSRSFGLARPSWTNSTSSASTGELTGKSATLDNFPTAFARDVYSHLHLPLVPGVVMFAFAVRTMLAHVCSDMDWVAALGLCGGSTVYLLTYVALRLRVARTLSLGRFTASVAFALLVPVAVVVPGLLALALVAVVWLV